MLGRLSKAEYKRSEDRPSVLCQYLPAIYTHALRALGLFSAIIVRLYLVFKMPLDVSSGGSAMPKPSKTSYPIECSVFSSRHMVFRAIPFFMHPLIKIFLQEARMVKVLAKLLVYTLEQNTAITYLEKLMLSVEMYLCPFCSFLLCSLLQE